MSGLATIPFSDKNSRHRQRMAQRSRENYDDVADIGPIPRCVDIARRQRLEKNLAEWLSFYLSGTFYNPFSNDHLLLIGTTQTIIEDGGQQLTIVYRGFGKSSISEGASLYAAITGKRQYIAPIAADKKSALLMLQSIKAELENNDLLLEDYPEVCYPVRCLEGKSQRSDSQHTEGERTHIQWTKESIVLPIVANSSASGVIIRPFGIDGSIRGARFKTPDGRQLRPDLVICDDIQTDKSAKSVAMTTARLSTLRKTVFRLGGHNKRIACAINGTIIQPDDAMEQLTDHDRFPSLQITRIPMVKKWSDRHEDLWLGQYSNLRNSFIPDDKADRTRAIKAANDFYAENRATMDAGAIISSEHCFDDSEISAIQHAYNILIDEGEEVFECECQNNPPRDTGDLEILTANHVVNKLSPYPQFVVPNECEKLTAFIDVQGSMLYYVVCAWQEDFQGYVIDYGAYPDQRKKWFTLRSARHTLQKIHGKNTEAAIFAGLTALTTKMLSREYLKETGEAMRVSRCLIDAQWGDTTDLVYKFCRASSHAAVVMPSHGLPISATKTPIAQWRADKGSKKGLELIVSRAANRSVRSIKFNANYHKKQTYEGLLLPPGIPGCIQLFKASPESHRMIAEHASSETPKRTEHDGRVVYEFQLKPNEDNHLWDGLVGCVVAASEQGILRPEQRPKNRNQGKPRKTLAQLAREAQG